MLLRRGRRLEVFTVAWNSLEGVVSVTLGALAGSIALVGFGVDSFIETSSGLILLWRLQTHRDAEDAERAEARALKLVGASLLLLAGYLLFDSVSALLTRERPQESLPGIALNAQFGWWWADPAAGIAMVPLIVREGREALRGERCGDCGACGTPACICSHG